MDLTLENRVEDFCRPKRDKSSSLVESDLLIGTSVSISSRSSGVKGSEERLPRSTELPSAQDPEGSSPVPLGGEDPREGKGDASLDVDDSWE